jgi:hypothetical protein
VPGLPGRSPRAAVILGNDAVVAARPCSAWQLAHACRAAGFDIVVAPTVGDELVAAAYLELLAPRRERAVVACHCPRARGRLAHAHTDTRIPAIRVVAPPIAAARALRLTHGASLLVTYVGDCPAADDRSINARFSPAGFLASLERQGIAMTAQPDAMPAAEAAPWQRYRSVPGGLPALRWLARAPVNRVLRDVEATAIQAVEWESSRANVLLDVSEAAACACGSARERIEEGEPLRASAASVVAPPGLEMRDDRLPPNDAGATNARVRPERTPSVPAIPSVMQQTKSVTALGGATTSPDPGGTKPQSKLTTAASAAAGHAAPIGEPTFKPRRQHATRPPAAERTRTTESATSPPTTRKRWLAIALLPVVVLGVVGALGMAVYAVSSGRVAHPASGESRLATDTAAEVAPPRAPVGETLPATATPSVTPTESSAAATQSNRSTGSDSATRPASGGAAPKPAPRTRRVEVVPGWLPQGRRTFTPIDTARARKDSASVPAGKPDTLPRT